MALSATQKAVLSPRGPLLIILTAAVTVRTKDLARLGDLIDCAISAGANNVQGVKSTVDDQRKLRQKA